MSMMKIRSFKAVILAQAKIAKKSKQWGFFALVIMLTPKISEVDNKPPGEKLWNIFLLKTMSLPYIWYIVPLFEPEPNKTIVSVFNVLAIEI